MLFEKACSERFMFSKCKLIWVLFGFASYCLSINTNVLPEASLRSLPLDNRAPSCVNSPTSMEVKQSECRWIDILLLCGCFVSEHVGLLLEYVN
jgi:hypothetical protein